MTDIAHVVPLLTPTADRIVMRLTAVGYLDHLPSGEDRPGVRLPGYGGR
jgi:IclR family pca regulon transcriptional regulator